MFAHFTVARAKVLMRRLSQRAILIDGLVLVAHGLFQILQAFLGATVGIQLPFRVGHDLALLGGIHNFEMAHEGVGIVEVGAYRSFGFPNVTRVRWRTPNDEAPERGHADGDALGDVGVFYWFHNQHSADLAL
jgi:hypothetical protein